MDTGAETIVIDFLYVQFENGKSNNIMHLIWTLENENTENEAICNLSMVTTVKPNVNAVEVKPWTLCQQSIYLHSMYF